jgi:hypothetical protein
MPDPAAGAPARAPALVHHAPARCVPNRLPAGKPAGKRRVEVKKDGERLREENTAVQRPVREG